MSHGRDRFLDGQVVELWLGDVNPICTRVDLESLGLEPIGNLET